MDHVDVANTFFTILTLAANASVIAALVLALGARVSARVRGVACAALDAVGPSLRSVAWVVATVAVAGSLYYSEIADFVPCRLCWFQRICMYPLAAILLVGLALRDRRVRVYAAPFVVVGAPISLYHWLMERGVFAESSSCAVTVPCAVPWFEELGYVTLAFMALSAFCLVGTLLVVDQAFERRRAGWVSEQGDPQADDDRSVHDEPGAKAPALEVMR
jgi:disulfide bond formation protein DsbB